MTDTLRALCALLDPVLVPRGFQAGQGQVDDRSGQVIWCSAHVDFRRRYPHLPQSAATSDPGASAPCVDLVVAVVDGELHQIELEGYAVPGTEALPGRSVTEGGPVLAQAVARLLVEPDA